MVDWLYRPAESTAVLYSEFSNNLNRELAVANCLICYTV